MIILTTGSRHLRLLMLHKLIKILSFSAMSLLLVATACSSKMNVSVSRGSSSAGGILRIEIGIRDSLTKRQLDVSKSASVASAAAKGKNVAGGVDGQALASLNAATNAIFLQFRDSSTDIASASQGVFEAVAEWLLAESSPKNVESSVKIVTLGVLKAIASNTTSSVDTEASLSGIFGQPKNIVVDGKTLSDLSSAVIAAIASAMAGDTSLNTAGKTAATKLTKSIALAAIVAGNFNTVVEALFKGVTDAASSLAADKAATTVKDLIQQIATSAAEAIAESSMTTDQKAASAAQLKLMVASTLDTLATSSIIATADVQAFKTSINSVIDKSSSTTSSSPEINVKNGTTSLVSGAGSVDFGPIGAGVSHADIVFTIENLGTGTLHLTGTPTASISGTDAAAFTVTSAPAATVSASSTQTFTVRFAPSTAGAKTATITIANDDSNEGSYTFSVTGTGVIGPEINVKQGATSLASGSGSQTFGSVAAGGGTNDVVFTIENNGTTTLNLSGTPRAALSGADAAEFSVTSAPPATIAASASQSFTIRFSPTTVGSKTATVTIANDDADEGSYTFIIIGTAAGSPEINVKQGVTSLLSGSGSHSFGSVAAAGGTADVVFTIENTGTGALNLTGTPRAALSGTNAADFSVTSAPPTTVAASSTQNFTVRFAPSTGGAKTATVTIANDDANEGTYTFTITGTATTSPEINIKQGSTSLASGSGSQSFGSVVASSGTADLTFTIENTGTAVLNLSGSPRAALSGGDAGHFSVTVAPPTTVAAGGTETFTIRFAPTTTGAKTATVTVANDDSNEGSYTFTITGTGTVAETSNSVVNSSSNINQTAVIASWSNLSNASGEDGAYASVTMNESLQDSARLELTGFGFTGVPSDATIDGVKVEILRSASGMTNSATCHETTLQLIVGGNASGSNNAGLVTNWPSVPTYAAYGSSVYKWGLGLTAADVRAANFGIAIDVAVLLPFVTGTCTANIDQVKMTVYYTPAAYKIFTTASTYAGNLGGISGADAKCQTAATGASLSGVWKALISDESSDVKTRLTFASGVPFKNMLDEVIATDATDLWGGSIDFGAHYGPNGVATNTDAWSGTNPNGTRSTGFTCINWSDSQFSSSGIGGTPSFTGGVNWISVASMRCDFAFSLLCVSQ